VPVGMPQVGEAVWRAELKPVATVGKTATRAQCDGAHAMFAWAPAGMNKLAAGYV